MARNMIPMAIAGLSTFIHVCLAIYTTFALIQVSVILAEPIEDDDGSMTTGLAVVGSVVIIILVISLLFEIALLIVSILLILGIKRERHQFIAPWIYLTGIYTILSFIGLIKGSNAMDSTFAIKVITIILHAAMWYPIFKYWRDLTTTRRNTNMPDGSPLNVCYTSQTPGVIYTAGPGNYPAPGYGPAQVPTAGGYYPAPQNYAGEQIQPSVNPQLCSVNYPRQMTTPSIDGCGSDHPPSYAKLRGVQEEEEQLPAKN